MKGLIKNQEREKRLDQRILYINVYLKDDYFRNGFNRQTQEDSADVITLYDPYKHPSRQSSRVRTLINVTI